MYAEGVNQKLIRQATECGAKGLLSWPATVTAIQARVEPFLSQDLSINEPKKIPASQTTAPKPAPAAPKKKQASAVVPASEEEKLLMAQRLLAQVLHNVKTSDLLGIVEADEVPRVVFEMTRSVCGMNDEPRKASAVKDEETEIDLASAFGMNK